MRTAGTGSPEFPEDLAGVAHDEELVEALAHRRLPCTDTGELSLLLSAWCEWADRPADLAVADEELLALVPPAPPARRPPLLRRLAVAAAVLVGLSVGTSTVAEKAHPGSPLWVVTRLVDHDRVRSLTAFDMADTSLDHAGRALDAGNMTVARHQIARARQATELVRPQDGRQRLTSRLDRLERRVGTARGRDAARPGTEVTGQHRPSTNSPKSDKSRNKAGRTAAASPSSPDGGDPGRRRTDVGAGTGSGLDPLPDPTGRYRLGDQGGRNLRAGRGHDNGIVVPSRLPGSVTPPDAAAHHRDRSAHHRRGGRHAPGGEGGSRSHHQRHRHHAHPSRHAGQDDGTTAERAATDRDAAVTTGPHHRGHGDHAPGTR